MHIHLPPDLPKLAERFERFTRRLNGIRLLGNFVSPLPHKPPPLPYLYQNFTSVDLDTRERAAGVLRRPHENLPLFSVITVCKNAAKFLPRAIASVKALEYPNVEYLIQDGASTDNTREVVEEAGLLGGFVSEPDRATLDGLIKAAERAKGEYIAVCWANDELMPHALGWAAAAFELSGAEIIYGDQVMVNHVKNTAKLIPGDAWDSVRHFLCDMYPPFSSSFFRRDILLKLKDRLRVFDHDEYEFWMWLHALGHIQYMRGIVSYFHVHEGTRWINSASYVETMCKGKHRAIDDMCASPEFPQAFKEIAIHAHTGVNLWAAVHLLGSGSIREWDTLCDYAEKALCGFNQDYRFGLLWNRFREFREEILKRVKEDA